ncbi:uncharacterized protein LOC141528047 isoform X1 [Cotesia typhae]|uniref:uncharacterized protein LOC141528047 isoform X1 n=1 Tax=Cotesia typhae TaxID=2053667 RepID=UPI003D699950
MLQKINNKTYDDKPGCSKNGGTTMTEVSDKRGSKIHVVNQQNVGLKPDQFHDLKRQQELEQQQEELEQQQELEWQQELERQLDVVPEQGLAQRPIVQDQQVIRRPEGPRHRNELRINQQHRLLEAQIRQQRLQNRNANYLQNDQFLVGDNFYISSAAYRDACNADTPAKFITGMADAMWPRNVLIGKVVRKQKNTGNRQVFTPRKIELLSYHFEFLNRSQLFRRKNANRT